MRAKQKGPTKRLRCVDSEKNFSKLEIKFGSKDFFMDGTIDLGGLIQAHKHV